MILPANKSVEEEEQQSFTPSNNSNNQAQTEEEKPIEQLVSDKPMSGIEKEQLLGVQPHKSTVQVLMMVLTVSFGSLFFGYSIGVTSLALDTIWVVFGVEESLHDTYSSLLNAAIPFGAMIGAVSAGKLLDIVSRKNAFFIVDAVGLAATLLSQITNINIFLVSRLLTGVITGFNSSLVPQYIQEVSPQPIAGIMGTVFTILINTGIVFASGMGQFFSETPISTDMYWRYVFLFPAIFSVMRPLLLALFFNHETPFYYQLIGDNDKSRKFLENIYQPEHVDEVFDAVAKQVEKSLQTTESYTLMMTPKYRKRLLIGCTLQLIQQFSGINAVIMYSGHIFTDSGYDFTLKNLLSLISNGVLLLAAVFSVSLVDKIGRKQILIIGTTMAGAFQCGLAILSIIDNKSLSFISVALIFAYFIAFNFSLGPIIWLYCSEILPSKGISIATMCNWLAGTILVFAVPYLNLSVLFIFYTAICFSGVLFIITFLAETKDKSKAEIALLFNPQKDSSISDDNEQS